MVTPLDLPVLFSEIPHVQKWQHSAQSGPAGGQTVLAEVVVQKQKEENKRILKPEKASEQEKIRPDKEKKDQAQYFSSKQSKRQKKTKEENTFPSPHLIDLEV